MKKNCFVAILLFISMVGNTKNVPNREILVFFSEGITQVKGTESNNNIKTFKFTSEKLKKSLNSIGVNDTLIEIALPKFNKSDTLVILKSGERILQPDMTNLYRIKITDKMQRNDIIERLKKMSEVVYAESNGTVSHHAIPNDSLFINQWGLRNPINIGADIHAVGAWDIYKGNNSSIIAIVDGGTDNTHVDLDDKVTDGDHGFGWSEHGVHVSGIAAAESNNILGISGIDWHARIHSQRVDSTDDVGTYHAILDAVNFGSNVHVLNFSWGLTDTAANYGRYSTIIRQAVAYAYKANRTFVASMGNNQLTQPNVVGYPAGYDKVIAVGATNNTDVIANFSAQGNHIDICAPGVGILSTLNGRYGLMSGTSMAAPHVSGVASLLKGYKPELANDDIENILKLSADDVNGNGYDQVYGFGRINAERALSYLKSPYTIVQNTATLGTTVNTSTHQIVQFISAENLATANYLVKKIEIQKTIELPNNLYNIIGIWGRGAFSKGWSNTSQNFGEGFCEIVPGSLTSTNVTLRTYVYQVWNVSGSYLGYYPASPSEATFAYSVLGYEKPTISGPTQICDQATYTIDNFPQGATVNWSTSNDLTVVSGQDTTIVEIARTYNLAVNTFIRATITINGYSFVIEKTGIQIGTINPLIKIYDARGRYELAPPYYTNMAYTIVAYGDTFSTNPFNYQWVVNQPVESGEPPLLYEDKQFSFIADSVGSYNFSLRYNGECGWSLPTSKAVYFYQNNLLLSFYPNPATDLLTVSVGYEEESRCESDISTKKTIYNESYCLELWHEKYGKVKSVESNESIVQIHLQDLPRGLYAIHLKVKNKTIRKKLLQLK